MQDHRTNLQRAWDNTPDPETRKAISQQIAQVNEEIRGLNNSGNIRESIAYRKNPDKAIAIVDTFKQLLKSPDGSAAQFGEVSQKAKDIVKSYTGENVSDNATIVIEAGYARHFNKHTRDGALPITDADIANITEVINDPDKSGVGDFVRGKQRVWMSKTIDKTHRTYVEVIKEGNALNVVTFFNESSRVPDTANGVSQSLRPKRDEFTTGNNIANFPRIVNRSDDSRYRLAAPRVSRAEIDSVNAELAPYGLSATKSDYNAALEKVAYEQNPELFENYNYTKEALDGLLERYQRVRIRPEDAQRLYGKNWREIVPPAYVRKDTSFSVIVP